MLTTLYFRSNKWQRERKLTSGWSFRGALDHLNGCAEHGERKVHGLPCVGVMGCVPVSLSWDACVLLLLRESREVPCELVISGLASSALVSLGRVSVSQGYFLITSSF